MKFSQSERDAMVQAARAIVDTNAYYRFTSGQHKGKLIKDVAKADLLELLSSSRIKEVTKRKIRNYLSE